MEATADRALEDPIGVGRLHAPLVALLRGRLRFWRSPPDQPRWSRPALLAIAAVAAAGYAYGIDDPRRLESFYGAAARSMSASWHDFLFGAFDPAGTVSVDKLPGALWLQALSARLLGPHPWTLLLPQILAGALTILVLYRAVRRLAGPVAGIVAAATLATTPVTVALNRGDVSDTLLILLTVLAADAASAAAVSGRRRSLLLAGVWVGLAFQAKMLQAWLVLPALALPYLIAAPQRVRTRVAHVAAAFAVCVVVSLSWMSVVSLVPAHERPYVDGTLDNSLFTQVFGYNGLERLVRIAPTAHVAHEAAFLRVLGAQDLALGGRVSRVRPSWHRLLDGPFGRDVAWLLPAAVLAAVALLLGRRRAARNDPVRALALLWGTWLLVLFVAFSAGRYLNSYYVAALSPAIAALCGAGLAAALHERAENARALAGLAILLGGGYAAVLLHGGTRVPGWLPAASVAAGAVGAVALAMHQRRAALVAVACALLAPAVTSALVVGRHETAFDAPFQPPPDVAQRAEYARANRAAFRESIRLLFEQTTPLAVDTSSLAAFYIEAFGRRVLPIGGFTGAVPAPTLSQLERDIAIGRVRYFLLPVVPRGDDPRVAWVEGRCWLLTPVRSGAPVQFGVYDCAGVSPAG